MATKLFTPRRLAGVLVGALLLWFAVPTAAGAGPGTVPRCGGSPATMVGTPGDDVINGTSGADVIVGLDGRDVISGLGGDDIICGGANPELLDEDGYPIDEYIDGGPGDDRLYGGPGRDTLASSLGDDVLHGGAGPDWVVGVNRDGEQNRGGFDRLFGDAGDDTLMASTSRAVLHGGPGDDVLEGDDRADQLFGDEGNDSLAPDAGNDRVSGGPGHDVVDYTRIIEFGSSASHTTAVTVNLAKGVASGKRFGTDHIARDVEGAYTGDGNDRLTGNARRNVFYGGYGDRTVVDGRGGRDLLTFDSENIDGSCCNWVRLDLRSGMGYADSPYGGRTRLRVRNVEDVQGSGEDDVLRGDDGPNRLIGGTFDRGSFGDGDDLLVGRGGDDVLIGSGDDDDLRGGGGADRLLGGGGDDRLDGGPGRNRLDGGRGTDTCVNPAVGPSCENP